MQGIKPLEESNLSSNCELKNKSILTSDDLQNEKPRKLKEESFSHTIPRTTITASHRL